MIVVGGKEAESRQVSVRSRKAGDEGAHPIDSFVERIKTEISERVL
jgi:threonyl-tRNA synthetase